ncbi:MAG: diphosphomevalonate decarboxylase [Myxococcales bacterium]|nr:diphosphomevalonate decarboxylase [Myxococcales bacterium]
MTQTATATAHPNIALVKYWGKRDRALNLPAAGSLSATLGPFRSRTTVTWGADRDTFTLDGTPRDGGPLAQVSTFLDHVRAVAAAPLGGAAVISDNDFPTAAGLASSSSGFAALAVAATAAAGVELPPAALSVLARQGSGSAARSVYGGYVEMDAGVRPDGEDAHAHPLFDASHWPLEVVIAVTVEGEKDVSSRDGMNRTQQTSPYFRAWIDEVAPAIAAARDAVRERDFDKLADVAEASALQMHASAIAAVPGVLYWRGATVEAIHRVRALRRAGTPVFFTVDAGPHVKAFTAPDAADAVAAALADVPGVSSVLRARVAGGPELL